MATRLATATRNALVDAVAARVDAGPGPGTIEIRTGTQPASANDAATGTLLAVVTCADPAFAAAASGSATLNGVPLSDTAADNTGTAGWFRILDSTGATVLDGSATGSGGGGDMTIDNPALVAGQTFTISTFTLAV